MAKRLARSSTLEPWISCIQVEQEQPAVWPMVINVFLAWQRIPVRLRLCSCRWLHHSISVIV